ncbi:MAG: type II toxin-antitoxin system VapC family toxin [Candidatus Nanopelagicales bacterium]|nr:type II toxin-antitoxin system VapC family toxin [Candidatus Nanopelagicales bacterium]
MIRYLDTSAAAKIFVAEEHTAALRSAVRTWAKDDLVASQLMAMELHRLAARLGIPAGTADQVLDAVELIDVDREDFVAARSLGLAGARTLDVLHVAVATRMGADELVTYDLRQAEVARGVGLVVTGPT